MSLSLFNDPYLQGIRDPFRDVLQPIVRSMDDVWPSTNVSGNKNIKVNIMY